MAWVIPVNMIGPKELCLWLIFAYYVNTGNCAVCKKIKENCHEIWSNGSPDNDTTYSNYRKNRPDDNVHIINWQWSYYYHAGKWSLYYKEWPRKAIQTGGFLLTIKRKQILAKLDWKVFNGVLIWTSVYRQPFEYAWNASVCGLNLPMEFESTKRGWRFQLGSILLTGSKSGVLHLNGTDLLQFEDESDLSALSRKRREIDELSDEQKKTVWNRIKGYFKELYDNGDNDQRNWMIRIKDWFLGFLERVLT